MERSTKLSKEVIQKLQHDIGNDITSIQSSVFSLSRNIPADNPAKDYVEKINKRLAQLHIRIQELVAALEEK